MMRFFKRQTPRSQMSDEQLAAEYKTTQDPELVGELFERYAHIVYLACMKYLRDPAESEDVAMQLFEKLMIDLRKYEVRSFRHWLHTVIRHQCLLHLDRNTRARKQSESFRETQQADMESGADLNPIADAAFREYQLEQLEGAIAQLNPEQRACIELFYLQRLSYQEVSDQTGYTMKQVKSYIQNGKRNLQKHLEGRPVSPSAPDSFHSHD
jgi:RNA polymerase sigma-70 factor (ECF subfamily)